MSLQVYSPHSHNQSSNDPQSPYPCTPSTLCSSPLTQSGSGGSGGNSTSNQSSYFRASHHHHHFVLREDSLPSIASSSTHDQHDIDREPAQEEEDDRIAQNYYHHRNTHARNKSSATLDSPEMPLSIRSPSMSTLGGGGTPDRTSPHGTVNKNRFRSEMKTYPSAASIPIILAGLNGLKQTERGGLELDHGKERSENSDVCRDSPNERSTVMKSDQEEESEQRGSVGLGLGILQDPIELIQVVPTRHASQCTRSKLSSASLLINCRRSN